VQEVIANKLTIKKRRQISLESRQSHVSKWKQSVISMSDYCREHDLALSSFSAWVQGDQIIKQSPFKRMVVTPSSHNTMNQGNVIEILVLDKLKIRLIDVTNVSMVVDIAKEFVRCS